MEVKTNKTMPVHCPSCGQILKVARLNCDDCETIVEGKFDISILAKLNPDDHQFVVMFLKSSGSLKNLAKIYSISYPTIRNRLDSIIEKIKTIESKQNEVVCDGDG